MHELMRTNDAVLISYLSSQLRDFGIEALVLDTHASILDGSIGAIPRRVMVADEDARRANRLLREILPEWSRDQIP